MSKRSEGWDDWKLEKEVKREMTKARKKAAKKVGPKITRTRRARLGKVSSRRKKAVKNYTAKDGSLIVADWAPLAEATEYGETIKSKSRNGMLISFYDWRSQKGKVKKVGKYLFGPSRVGNTLVGIYLKTIRIGRNPKTGRFRPVVEEYAEEYYDLIEKNITEGMQ